MLTRIAESQILVKRIDAPALPLLPSVSLSRSVIYSITNIHSRLFEAGRNGFSSTRLLLIGSRDDSVDSLILR
jgi:hypothetical protein